jgi:AbrB family looped-hinge helix DNA binding protein
VTAPLIAPVIPSSARPPARGHRAAGGGRRLPVVAVPVPPAAPDDVLYGFGRIDMAGRVADRAVISALGWRRGDRLTLTGEAGVVTARRDPAGMVAMTAKPYIVIPAALRRRCGLRPGDRVLVAVAPADDMLAAYSLAVVDQAIRAHSTFLHARGGQQ